MSSQPCVDFAIPDPDGSFVEARLLVVCNDTMFMVIHPIDNDAYSFEMYKLDLKNMTCVPSTNLGDCSLFLGLRTFSIASKNRLIPANCIYYCNRYLDENAMYNLSTNRLKFSTKKPFLNPNSLVRKLIIFCLRQNPILLQQEDGSTIDLYED